MDVEFWIYIIIGVIYFLSRLFKKGEEASSEVPQTPRRERTGPASEGPPAGDAPRQLTFEELLREITEGKQARKPEPVSSYKPYESDPGEEARSLEDVSADEVETVQRWKPYEEIPARTGERRSLEETLRLEDTVMDFGKFAAFQQREKKKLSDDYIKMLRNPETLKHAIVVSEILKRKF